MTAEESEAELVLQTVERITAILTRSVTPCEYQTILLMRAEQGKPQPEQLHEAHLWVRESDTGDMQVRFCQGEQQ